MKKYTSVFNVITRSSIYKILGVLLVMSALEVGFYMHQMNEMLENYEVVREQVAEAEEVEVEELVFSAWGEYYISSESTVVEENPIITIEDMFLLSHTTKIFTIAFIVISILLCLTGCNFGSRQDYTWKRLQVSEKSVFFVQTIYNAMTMLLFLAVQVIVAYGLCRYYVSVVPEGVTNQSVFLAFYRSTFLHSILPLEATLKWIVNILLMVAMGFATAIFPYRQRRGKISFQIILMIGIALIFFPCELGKFENSWMLLFWDVYTISICLWDVLRKKGEIDER